MQQTKQSHLAPQLAVVVNEIVEMSTQAAESVCDASQVIDDLVTLARWNPALLMAAAEQVDEMIDRCPEDHLKVGLHFLLAAEEQVRRRAY